MARHISGRDLVAVPFDYLSEFVRDPMDSIIKYGALPQRGRSLWITEPEKVRACSILPNLITGADAQLRTTGMDEWNVGIAHPHADTLIGAITPDYIGNRTDWQSAAWHVHVDPGLNRGRKGDASAIAVGRIVDQVDISYGGESRRVNRYIVPIVMQVMAPEYGEITLSSLTRFILQMRGQLMINITSFSYDGFQSAGSIQELTAAGLITAGVKMDEFGRLVGFGKPYSVDRSAHAHQELKEAINETRILLPDYFPIAYELNRLEDIPGRAPDHPPAGSKDVADAVAGVIGYLAEIGHAVFIPPKEMNVSMFDLPMMDGVKAPNGHFLHDAEMAKLSIE